MLKLIRQEVNDDENEDKLNGEEIDANETKKQLCDVLNLSNTLKIVIFLI